MSLLIGFLTFILVVDCLLLMLLILIQLPKKEAGAGIAFGGAATDALFGAGSGNALTRMTKYTAGIFLILAFSLSLLNSREAQSPRRKLEEELRKKMNALAPINLPPGANTNALPPSINLTQAAQSVTAAMATNLTNAATTNQSVPLVNTNLAAATPTQIMASPKPAATNPPTANATSAVTNAAATSLKTTATNQATTNSPGAPTKP